MNNKLVFVSLAVVAVGLIAVTVFRVSAGSLLYIGALAACPLLHVLMMRGGKHDHS